MTPLRVRTCAYCGLPAPAWWRAADEAPVYCCYGCRFAARVTESTAEGGAPARWLFARLGLAIFFTMNVMAFTMALWSADVYPAIDAPLAGLFRYLCLFFALPVLWWLGVPLAENAWAGLRSGVLSTDLLLVIGVAASYVYSSVSVLSDEGPVYFEVGCAVLLLVTLGRWCEATGRSRATHALDALEKLLPERVRLLDDGAEKPLSAVTVGDRLHVRAGERVPCDGMVLRQPVRLDEQLVTGESAGCVKEPGDPVHAGTLNLDGDLFIEVQRLPDAGALSRIVAMIRQAHASKGCYEQLADRVTAWFLPTVVAIALAAGVFHTAHHGFDRGLMAGLAVLVIACPCALGIATPLAIWVAMNEAARQQVVFRSGEALERLASIRHLGIDKTGTLTHGKASGVATWIPGDPHDAAHALERARALAAVSNHSLAQAIAAHGDKPAKRCDHVQTLPGRGLRGSWPDTGETIWVGSDRLMAEQHLAVTQCLAEAAGAARTSGQPLVFIGWGDSVRGLFIIREEIRSEAAAAIAELRDLGVRVTILTGDHARRAEVVAGALRVEARGEMLPENKVAFIAGVPGPVGMVGDGINDGPALAASDVGIAMGCGADVTRDSAGVCLLSDDLTRLPWAINLARRTVGVIRQNLFWALAYNVVGIGLAAAGLLNPVLAAAAMTVSSVLVVANSLRLRGPDKEAAPCLKPS